MSAEPIGYVLEEHVIRDAASPIDTTIDLSDYWLDDEAENRCKDGNTEIREGCEHRRQH